MKITKAIYFGTFPVGVIWQKIGLEGELIEGDDLRQCLYDLKRQVESFHFESTKAEEKKLAVIKGEQLVKEFEQDEKTNKEWEVIKAAVAKFKFKNEAYEYLKEKGWHLSIEAKNLINHLPAKIELLPGKKLTNEKK